MKILLFAESDCHQAMGLEKRILAGLPGTDIIRIAYRESLEKQLSRPMNAIAVVLVFVPSILLLKQLTALKGLLDNKKLILILPGENRAETALSLELGPSFITHQDQDLTDVILVLNQIRQKHCTTDKVSNS